MLEIVVYDCLLALRQRRTLFRLGDLSLHTRLEGAPFAHVVFDYLRRNHLIWPMHGTEEEVERWVLSNRGYEVFCRIEMWYRALPLHLRLLGRLGIAERRIRAWTPARAFADVWAELA